MKRRLPAVEFHVPLTVDAFNVKCPVGTPPAPRFTSLEGGAACPGCAGLREQNRLLSEHNLVLLTRVRAFEERDRLGADMMLGLAGLQKAAGA